MVHREIEFPSSRSFFLFGPRQTGKSTLLQERFPKATWKVDLLLSENALRYGKDPAQFRREATYQIEQNGIRTICIDEVQRVPELLNEVHGLIESRKCRFILTGSSARKLRRGGVNLLGGRASELRLYPFTVAELGSRFDLEDCLRFGTLPAIWGNSEKEKTEGLRAYVIAYLEQEIKAEGLSRNIGGFARFLDMAAQQSGELISYSAVARECALPVRTVQSYYEILEDTLIAFRLPGWRHTVRKQLSGHPKFYLFDTGVTNAINRMLGGELDSRLKGRLFEQFIILETDRRLNYAQSETRMFYWRTNTGAEVDLILERHGKPVAAIEIKFGANPDVSAAKGLKAFHSENPKTPLFIVSRAVLPYELEGVTILPWQAYLEKLSGWV